MTGLSVPCAAHPETPPTPQLLELAGCQLTTPHKLQGGGALGKPILGAARWRRCREDRWPRPVSFMRWLAGSRRADTGLGRARRPGRLGGAGGPGGQGACGGSLGDRRGVSGMQTCGARPARPDRGGGAPAAARRRSTTRSLEGRSRAGGPSVPGRPAGWPSVQHWLAGCGRRQRPQWDDRTSSRRAELYRRAVPTSFVVVGWMPANVRHKLQGRGAGGKPSPATAPLCLGPSKPTAAPWQLDALVRLVPRRP